MLYNMNMVLFCVGRSLRHLFLEGMGNAVVYLSALFPDGGVLSVFVVRISFLCCLGGAEKRWTQVRVLR